MAKNETLNSGALLESFKLKAEKNGEGWALGYIEAIDDITKEIATFFSTTTQDGTFKSTPSRVRKLAETFHQNRQSFLKEIETVYPPIATSLNRKLG